MMLNLNDLVVIITGASSGIGEATARELADGGAKLMLAARREERLQQLAADCEKRGAQVRYCVVDVTDREACRRMADETKSAFGRIDVIFNNAGIMPLAPMAKCRVDDWDKMVDVNVKGLLYCVAAVLPTMLEQQHGHIINCSSVAGHKVFPAAAVYCGTKFAVRAISEGIRQESGDRIRSTNISPGAIATELTDHIPDKETQAQIKERVEGYAIPADAIARAVRFAIEQPWDVDVNEITVRPTAQEL